MLRLDRFLLQSKDDARESNEVLRGLRKIVIESKQALLGLTRDPFALDHGLLELEPCVVRLDRDPRESERAVFGPELRLLRLEPEKLESIEGVFESKRSKLESKHSLFESKKKLLRLERRFFERMRDPRRSRRAEDRAPPPVPLTH